MIRKVILLQALSAQKVRDKVTGTLPDVKPEHAGLW
jgi:hypothetical protein